MASRKKKAAPRSKPDTRELEAAIEAQPEESAPWLVLGDLLQAHGDPRGELINVQHLLETAKGPAWAKLKLREAELLETHSTELLGPLSKWPKLRSTRVWWHRGFAHAISTDGFRDSTPHEEFLSHPSARFLAHLGGVAPRGPMTLLRSVADQPFALEALGDFPRLETIDAELVPAARPASQSLRQLVVRSPEKRVLTSLAKANFPALETLTLDDLKERDVKLAVAAVERLKPKQLEVCLDAGFGEDDDFSGLAPVASRITTLGFDDLFPLSQLSLPKVHTLFVRSAQGDGEEFSTLPPMPSLRRASLFLPSDRIRYLRAFATSALANRLEELCVYLGKPGAGLALTEGKFEKLRALELRFDETFSPEYLKVDQVLAAKCWAGVTTLRLQPAWVGGLRGTPMAKSIEVLRIPVRGWVRDLDFLPRLKKLIVEVDGKLEAETFAALGGLECEVELAPAFSSGFRPRRGALEL